ncbi:hypothetical protein J4225_01100 [Candidatus Pacearchaeota archaeon]|nr:hypothetical protein [Candidatus Pacearchaeota archaeon]
MNKNENLIHVRLDYEEAREAKKDMLSLELSLVKLIRAIKTFKSLRLEELRLKKRLKVQISEFLKDMRKLKTELPELEIPRIIRHDEETGEIEGRKELDELSKKVNKKYDSDIEEQLRDIRERLSEMGRR